MLVEQLYPRPWAVKYHRRFPEWDKKASPYIVDATGKDILRMPKHTDHPGKYDQLADELAQLIVASVNADDRKL